MSTANIEQLRFPIGPFEKPETLSQDQRNAYINDIKQFPELLEALLPRFDDLMLHKTYRPGGWTARQVIHHCSDSHMNCLIRIKLALTEDEPTIKPYLEAKWAELADTQVLPVEVSMQIIKAVHQKIHLLLTHMSPSDFNRTYIHPQYMQTFSIDQVLALYAWHGKHHLGHLKIILGVI